MAYDSHDPAIAMRRWLRWAWVLVLVAVLVRFSGSVPDHLDIDWGSVSRIPVQANGRVQPMDTVARNALLFIHGKQSLGDQEAMPWLMTVMADAQTADTLPHFVVYHSQLHSFLGLPNASKHRMSFQRIEPYYQRLIELAEQFRSIEVPLRDAFQQAVIRLDDQMQLYIRLKNTLQLETGTQLSPEIATALRDRLAYFSVAEGVAELVPAYRASDGDGVTRIAHAHRASLVSRVTLESVLNRSMVFYQALVWYSLVMIMILGSYRIGWMAQGIFVTTAWAFGLHSVGLLCRMVIENRPPVTNLYSSAVFVGWGVLALALSIGPRIQSSANRSIVLFFSLVINFLTLIIAHHLSIQGDTLEMLQAVLDTNFWLSTHVVIMTLGYSAMLLAGFLGMYYVVRRLVDHSFEKQSADLVRLTLIIVMVGLSLSSVGTILGGIWADQSWGRFWGWDPKENGALLVVLWGAIILHARLAGWIKNRGLMVLAIAGNSVVAFSWFGVNMLGIGLHAYGFMNKSMGWLIGFYLVNGFFMYLGLLPKRFLK